MEFQSGFERAYFDMRQRTMTEYDSHTIAVIGAGITGITTAYSLAKRGYHVEVIERESYPGMMTSFANGGQFSVSNADTWCTWQNVGKGIKWMLKKDAPLLVRPMPSISKLRWLAGFLWNTVNGSQQSNTEQTIGLALRARKLYQDIAYDENIEFNHARNGILHFYKDKDSFKQAKQSCRFYQDAGVKRIPLSKDELLYMEPALAKAEGIIGGTYTPDDGMGDIHKFCVNLARVLELKYLVKFRYNTEVYDIRDDIGGVAVSTNVGVDTRTDRYAHVIVCAGSDSGRFGYMLHDPICVYPVKGYSITIPLVEPLTAPRTSLLDDDAKIVTSTLGDRFRVAGTAELDGWNRDIRMDRISPLVRWVNTNLPDISTEHAVPWAGLRPMTPSMMPIVRQSYGSDRVWWNTGHGHLGWTLAPSTAEITADMIAKRM